ncbi:MAG: hypothetical protein AB7U20_12165 [Planctomycetaceae bacterium]
MSQLSMMMLLSAGGLSQFACRNAPPPKAKEGNSAVTNAGASAEQCERTLVNLLDGLAPGRFGISSDRGDLVGLLNHWLEQCADSQAFSASPEDEALRAKLLSPDVHELTTRARFTDQDAAFFRNTMLVRDLVDAALLDERTDRERAVSLFYQVIETIDLRDPSAEGSILSPYETALFGWGTAADRAWLFGMMLRQLRLDAVVIRPRAADAGSVDSFLVGVIVPEEGVFLFDFQLGLPITSPAENDGLPLPRNPVTLTAAKQDDAVFRQYDLRGAVFPLNVEQLQDVEVRAIGESSTWSPRFGLVQAALSTPLELFDGLAAHSFREHGIIERLVIAGQDGLWNEEDVGIWDYPDNVYRNAQQISPQQQQQLQTQGLILEAPWSVTLEQQGEQVVPSFAPAKQNLHVARIRHLQGDYETALRVYLNARLAQQTVMDQPFELNNYASDWSAYWAALAQYDQDGFKAAADSTERYLRQPGFWNMAAKVLRAKALVQAPEPQLREAANLLARELTRSPQRAGNQWLVRRWRELAKAAAQAPLAEPGPDAEPTLEQPTTDEVPKQTPQDLPAAEKPADPRFQETTPGDLPPPPAEEPADPACSGPSDDPAAAESSNAIEADPSNQP